MLRLHHIDFYKFLHILSHLYNLSDLLLYLRIFSSQAVREGVLCVTAHLRVVVHDQRIQLLFGYSYN